MIPAPGPGPAADPLPAAARTELRRIADRWHTLPVGDAVALAPRVRALAQRLADETADTRCAPPAPLPDLGPAVVVDQLHVAAYDASAAGLLAGLADRLADLRRSLS